MPRLVFLLIVVLLGSSGCASYYSLKFATQEERVIELEGSVVRFRAWGSVGSQLLGPPILRSMDPLGPRRRGSHLAYFDRFRDRRFGLVALAASDPARRPSTLGLSRLR